MHGRERLHARERPLELADVALHLVGYEAEYVFRNEAAVGAELGMEDGEAGLEVRGLAGGSEPPLHAIAKPVLERPGFLGQGGRRGEDAVVRLSPGAQRVSAFMPLSLPAPSGRA